MFELNHYISFFSAINENIKADLYGRTYNTICKDVSWINFPSKIVELFITPFELQKGISINGNVYADIKTEKGQISAMMAVRQHIDATYIIIFYYDDGESRRNPSLYVHGIWEVELSEELKKFIFEK
jgi:hypothetical protein